MGGNGSKDKTSSLIETIADHDGSINCMAMSEDTSLLVTGSEDCTARMWSTKTEETECLGILKGHTGYVTCLTVSDVYVVSGSADETIRLWSLATCECLQVFKGHTARIYRLICTGDFILSTSYDKTAKVWLFNAGIDSDSDSEDEDEDKDKVNEYCVRTLTGHSLAVYPIVYIPSDAEFGELEDEDVVAINPFDVIITGSADNTVKSWNLFSGSCTNTFKGHKGAVMCLVTDSIGKTLYSGSADKTIRSWNIQRGDSLKVMEGHDGPIMCLTVNNKLLYSGSQDGKAMCWVREFGDCTRVYHGAKHSIVGLKVQDGILYTASGDTCCRAYDAKSGSLKRLFQGHGSGIQCLQIMKNKIFTGSNDGTVKIWNISDINNTENSGAVVDEDDEEDQAKTDKQQRNIQDIEGRLNEYEGSEAV